MSPEADDSLPEALYDRLGFLLGQAHLAHRVIAESRLASLGIGVKAFGALAIPVIYALAIGSLVQALLPRFSVRLDD